MVTNLFHFTCEHGRRDIGLSGELLPAACLIGDGGAALLPHLAFVWMTDLSRPAPEFLGLQSRLVNCNRIRYRYDVDDLDDVVPWTVARRAIPRVWRRALENRPGVLPMHWWVSRSPRPAHLSTTYGIVR